MAGNIVSVDCSQCAGLIEDLRKRMTPEKFNQRMYSVFQRTSRKVATILKADLPKEYKLRSRGPIGQAVKRPQIQNMGMGVTCVIPVVAPRGTLGKGRRTGFAATNGRRGWNTKKKYKIKVKVLQGSTGTLPANLPGNYGGQPPFRNLSAPKLNNIVFTREGKNRLPIRVVTGIAIPQMVSNRSKEAVQKDIVDFLQQRLIHELEHLIRTGS